MFPLLATMVVSTESQTGLQCPVSFSTVTLGQSRKVVDSRQGLEALHDFVGK